MASNEPLVRSFEECEQLCARKRNWRTWSGKITHNTYLHCYGGVYHVQLHQTDIVSFYPDGRILLNSGGFRTATTKNRMNRCLPDNWGVYQEKHVWYLCRFLDGGVYENYEFFDGITVVRDRVLPRPSHTGVATSA